MGSSSDYPVELWRQLAVRLFPDREVTYSDPEERVWFVLFELQNDVIEAYENNDTDLVNRIYSFTQWCYSQKEVEPELWEAAYLAFYEHLVEYPSTYFDIPHRLSPEIFEELLPNYEERLDDKIKFPMERPGTFRELLQMYDNFRDTNFLQRISEWKR